ncbi:CBO0543 family protein [Bacillus sp. FJAT-45066]|uniref:CBO0543 family protein n=1 Tax=Bacillus sp. FJAT-45066 TaxID=2011010 RepID=UPI000BB9A130|nr:CBO0543 family protein [Bacillus sp. FJAT-45066]
MAYKKEKVIEITSWLAMTFLLIKFIPIHRLREAMVAFLFKQAVTWLFGLLIVEKDMIRYPFKTLFKKSIKSSFTFEYFVLPSLNVLFNIHYPEKRNFWNKLLYYFSYTSSITLLEIIAVKYTKLIKYKKWKWYWSFLSIWFTYYVGRRYQRWFFKEANN